MAVVSPVPAITQRANTIRYRDVGVPDIMASRGEIVGVIRDKIYVAVGKYVKESKSVLLWALQNSGGKGICIIHVHQPAMAEVKEQEVRAYREIERQEMHKILDKYLLICRRVGVRAEKLCTEMECIENWILELISENGIRKLVMGAAADKHYSRKMIDLKSKKAISVRLQAPASCHIWFICKGQLIHTREGI